MWGEKIYTDEWLVLHVSMCLVLGCFFPMEDLVSLPNGVWAKPKREKGKTFPEKASLTSCLSAWLGLVSLPRGRQVSPPLALARKLISRRWGWGTVYQALRVLSRMMVVKMVKMMEIGWFVCSVIETVDPAVGHQALNPKSKPISQRMMMTILSNDKRK